MKESFYVKEDYTEAQIQEVRDLLRAGEELALEAHSADLLLPVPRNDGIDIWNRGFAFVSVHPRSFAQKAKNYYSYFMELVCDPKEEAVKAGGKGENWRLQGFFVPWRCGAEGKPVPDAANH